MPVTSESFPGHVRLTINGTYTVEEVVRLLQQTLAESGGRGPRILFDVSGADVATVASLNLRVTAQQNAELLKQFQSVAVVAPPPALSSYVRAFQHHAAYYGVVMIVFGALEDAVKFAESAIKLD